MCACVCTCLTHFSITLPLMKTTHTSYIFSEKMLFTCITRWSASSDFELSIKLWFTILAVSGSSPLAVDSSHLKWASIAHSHSFSSFHRLDMTEILVKDVKLDTSYFRAKKGNSEYVLWGYQVASKS